MTLMMLSTLVAMMVLLVCSGVANSQEGGDAYDEYALPETNVGYIEEASSTEQTTNTTPSDNRSEQTYLLPGNFTTYAVGWTDHSIPHFASTTMKETKNMSATYQILFSPTTTVTVTTTEADNAKFSNSNTPFQQTIVTTTQSEESSTLTPPLATSSPTTLQSHTAETAEDDPPSSTGAISTTSPPGCPPMPEDAEQGPSGLLDVSSRLGELPCGPNACGPVLSFMDHRAQPCEDFYQYACGGLGDNPQLLDQRADDEVARRLSGQILSISGRDNSSYGQLKNFYDSCISYAATRDRTERILEVVAAVRRLGRLHTQQSWQVQPVDLTDLLVDLLQLDSTPLFDILLDEHETNSSKFVVKVVPPTKTPLFQEKRKTQDTDICKRDLSGWKEERVQVSRVKTTETFEKVLETHPDFQGENFSETITETFRNLQENVIEVIEKYLPFEDYFRWISVTKKYDVMTVEDLQRNFDMVNWTRLISKLLSQTVENATEVHVYYKPYLENLFHYLSEADMRLLHNSLVAMFGRELYRDVAGPAVRSRRDHCLAIVKELLPDVAASLYLRTFPSDTASQVQRAFSGVKQAMAEQVGASGWLDGASKSSALEKLAALDVVAGGGRGVLGDPRLLDDKMAGYEVNSSNYLANFMNLRQRKRHLLYGLFPKNASAEEQLWTYLVSPMQTQEPLLYNHRMIVVPYAVLPRGGVGAALSKYSVAKLGVTLARMLAHHFDLTGIHYGPNGTQEDVVSAEFYHRYSSNVKHRVSEEVSKMDKSVCKHRRSRSLLANDFISDAAALKMALRVFKRNNTTTTELQWFFLAMAQTTCRKHMEWDLPAPASAHLELPLPARLNAAFAQSPHFSSVFGCGASSNTGSVHEVATFPGGPRQTVAT